MAITTPSDLAQTFNTLLEDADELFIATAWASPGEHINSVREWAKNGGRFKAIIGLSGTTTVPTTLRDLGKIGDLRTPGRALPHAQGFQGLFHPKFYVFKKGSNYRALVGSANFTNGGFVSNFEVCVEAAEPKKLKALFDELWEDSEALTSKKIDEYEVDWAQRPRTPQKPPLSKVKRSQHPGKAKLSALDWDGYVAALKAAEDYWWRQLGNHRVWGDELSYEACIDGVQEVLLQRNWEKLSAVEKEMILAHRPNGDLSFAFGLLGSMAAAGEFKAFFSRPDLADARKAMKTLLTDFHHHRDVTIDDVLAVLEALIQRKGIAIGAATRLMTIVRPDICISVNNANTVRLEQQSGVSRSRFKQKSTAARAYGELLEWRNGLAWFHAPEPNDALERAAWRKRSALIDAIVYDPALRDG